MEKVILGQKPCGCIVSISIDDGSNRVTMLKKWWTNYGRTIIESTTDDHPPVRSCPHE